MNIKALETRNRGAAGPNRPVYCNLFAHASIEGEKLFGFITKDGSFLRYAEESEWENAVENWNQPVTDIHFPYNVFPIVRRRYITDTEGIEYRKYEDRKHPLYGKIQLFHFEEGERVPSYNKISINEAVILRSGGQVPAQRSTYQIESGKSIWENVQQSKEKALKLSKEGEYVVDAIGVDEYGRLATWHCRCTKENCNCDGSWWEGQEDNAYDYYDL